MEYQKRCRTCGKIFCYTDYDVKESKSNAVIAVLAGIGTMANAIDGSQYDMYEQNKMGDRALSKITDFDRCPYCNSTDVYLMDEKEFKRIKREEQVKSVNISGDINPISLLKRASLFLEDHDWDNADAYAENALIRDPENPYGYLYKLMADKEVPSIDELQNLEVPFFEDADFKKAIRFADEDLKTQLQDIVYGQAVNKMNEAKSYEDYMAAAELLDNISHKDSADLSAKCRAMAEEIEREGIYNSAIALMESFKKEDYTKAIDIFKTISDFKDSKEQIHKCEECISEINEKERITREEAEDKAKKNKKTIAIIAPIVIAAVALVFVFVNIIMPNSKYNSALKAIDEGDYIQAYESLIKLGDYKDSSEKAGDIYANYELEKMKSAEVGDIVLYGKYEQDNDSENDKEDIEWIVLDKEDNKILLISKYCLDSVEYNNYDSLKLTWMKSSIRRWLNDEFMRIAFSEKEREKILKTELVNNDDDAGEEYKVNGGGNSVDKVFLLSTKEYKKYFSSDSDNAIGYTTEYAKSHQDGTWETTDKKSVDWCWWWLRTRKNWKFNAAASMVNEEGVLSSTRVGGDLGIRPAMWISLES